MKILQRYFAIEITQAVLFVLASFLAFFSIFELQSEMQVVGRGGYHLPHAFLYVLLKMPSNAYLLMPIAALIGTIFALAQFASRSEFTIMRASSMSTLMAGTMLAKIGFFIAIATLVLGEFIAPLGAKFAETLKLKAEGSAISQEFRSGLWAKDLIKDSGLNGAVIGSRFINVAKYLPDGQLQGVKLYEFDREFRLTGLILAARADYQETAKTWRLSEVTETHFSNAPMATRGAPANLFGSGKITNLTVPIVSTKNTVIKDFVSEITPGILSVMFADPDKMSAYDLWLYTKHLVDNKQDSKRYQIAFWKKIIYPFAVLVMMALALPFAYLHYRSGGVSLKIFTGIMIGVSFVLLDSLFSHVGILNTWPAFVTAVAPSALFLMMATSALWWVERR